LIAGAIQSSSGPLPGPVSKAINWSRRAPAGITVMLAIPPRMGAVGPPDVIFFALYLAAADRFRLRVAATFGAMVALLAATIVLSAAINVDGLPVLDGEALRGVLTRRSIAAILHARAEAQGQAL